MSKGVGAEALGDAQHLGRRDEQEHGARDRRSGGSATGRRCGRSSAARASPRRCGPGASRGGSLATGTSGRPGCGPARGAAFERSPPATPAWRSQAATPWLSFSPFWQMTTAERPGEAPAPSRRRRVCERRTEPGTRRGSAAKSSSVRTSMSAGQSGVPIRRASLSMRDGVDRRHGASFAEMSWTRCFGMSPRGEIAVPMAGT